MNRLAVVLMLGSLVSCGGRVSGQVDPGGLEGGIDSDPPIDSTFADTVLDDDWVPPPDVAVDVRDGGVDGDLPPKVTHVSGSASYSSATYCTKSDACSYGEHCTAVCNSCSCDSPHVSTPGTWRCSTSICPSSGSGCPLRIPRALDPCTGDIVCEYDSACEGKRHRVACVNGSFRVTYAWCAPRCPLAPPEPDAECWAEDLLCRFPRSGCADARAACHGGRWRVTVPSCSAGDSGLDWPCRSTCASSCPTTMPRSGAACGADSKVGEGCHYAASLSAYATCLCMDGTWACFSKSADSSIGAAPPGSEQAPYERCASSSWCTGEGACCSVGLKLGCTCKASGYVCGEGEGCW